MYLKEIRYLMLIAFTGLLWQGFRGAEANPRRKGGHFDLYHVSSFARQGPSIRSSPSTSMTHSRGFHRSLNLYDQIEAPQASISTIVEGRTWENTAQLEPYGGINRKGATTKDPSIPENPVGLTDPSLLVGPYEETPDLRDTDVRFKGINGSNVTAQIGSSVNISCTVLNRKDHETVSWIRLRDHHVITVGRQTYSSDERFSVTFNRHFNEWILHLRYVQPRDAGRYICQVSTHPPMAFVKTLTITEAISSIDGGSERIVQEGSIVRLNCSIAHLSQPPEYVFWFHNGTMINYAPNRQVQVNKTNAGSVLTLVSVSKLDSGNYTCVPSNARHASTTLHVIQGDAPAAMQASPSSKATPNFAFLACVYCFIRASLL